MNASRSLHADHADTLHAVLHERFWLPRQRLFRVTDGRQLSRFGPWHYWWQSQALSALLDRYDRTGDDSSRQQAYSLVEGMRARGRGRLTNDFYDDMGWLALALLRMPGRQDDLAVLTASLRGGSRPEGGVPWSRLHPEFRNLPATGPAAIVALRLGARAADDGLVEWGLGLLRWIEDTLVGPDGDVRDGLRVHADGTVDLDAARHSYNFGLVIGAELAADALGMDRRPSDRGHLDRALVVALAALRLLTDPATGTWVTEGPGDRALFRGILARHLTDLALVTGSEVLAAAVRTQADAVWRASRGGPVGCDWWRPSDRRVELAEHVGGLLVVEAAARLS